MREDAVKRFERPIKELLTTGAQTLRAAQDGSPTVTLSLTGDICLVGGVEARLLRGEEVFRDIAPLLDADLVVGNLETALATRAQTDTSRSLGRGLGSRPDLAGPLFELGFDAFCLANNHSMDFGGEGLRETLTALRERGVGFFGAGDNLSQARQPLVIERNGLRIGFLGYSQPELDNATDDRPGVAPLLREIVLEDLARVSNTVDALVVTLHEGYEFSDYPRLEFRDFCREVAEGGAAVVCGHHPHVPQGIETHRGALILYSLGNFIFDIPYHRTHEWTRKSVVARITLDAGGPVGVELKPVVLTDDCLLRPADGEERRIILAHMRDISAPLDDDNFIVQANTKFVNEMMKVIMDSVYTLGKEENEKALEFFWTRQFRRSGYLKGFTDFAELVGGYRRLAPPRE